MHSVVKSMNSKIYDLNDINKYDEALRSAAEAVRNGGLVVFPTETVYGLGADATNDSAVKKIFQAKGRPSDNPLIVHFAKFDDCYEYVGEVSDAAKTIAEHFMPGPVTVIVKKGNALSPTVTAGLDTVAVRVPSDRFAHDFLKEAGCPVAAPSANISGKPSPTRAEYALEDMNGRADVILCGGDCLVGLESTVVDCTTEKVKILRPGAVTAEELMKVVTLDESSISESQTQRPRSPGMKYRHYKPDAYVIAVDGSDESIIKYLNDADFDEKCAVIMFDSILGHINAEVKLSLGDRNHPETAAHDLFAHFRYCDRAGITKIYVSCMPTDNIGDAYMNRLNKATDEYMMLGE